MLERALPFVALILAVAITPRLRDLSHRANPGRRAMTGVLVSLLVGVVCAAPALGHRLVQVVGVPHLDVLLGRLAMVFGCYFAMRGFSNAYEARGIFLSQTLDRALLVLVVGAVIVSFLLAKLPDASDPLIDQGGQTTVGVFVLASNIYLGWCCAGIVVGWFSWKREAPRRVRTGLLFTTLAGATGVLYVVGRCVGELLLLADDSAESAVEVTRQLCLAAGIGTVLFIVVGASWAPGLAWTERAWAEVVRRRRLHQLRPLWRDLVEAVPEVRLESSNRLSHDLLARNSRWQLYRRVIEILDALAQVENSGQMGVAVQRAVDCGPEDQRASRADVEEEAQRLARLAKRYRAVRREQEFA